MKSVLLMTLAGTSLFGGTVVGLLAVQGRLNFDGTRGVPVLESLFAEPAETESEDSHVTPAGEEHPRLEGLGREPRTAEQGVDAREQNVRPHGLGQVVVDPGVERRHFGQFVIVGSQHQDGLFVLRPDGVP